MKHLMKVCSMVLASVGVLALVAEPATAISRSVNAAGGPLRPSAFSISMRMVSIIAKNRFESFFAFAL